PSEKERLSALKGKVAIANAKLAYQDYKRLFAGPRWEKLAAKGAKPQRLLWASTGTKNKDYSDVMYVEELIGPDTINTMPPATLDAFRDHGKLRDSLEENVDDARRVLEELERSGVSLDAITEELVKDGVKLFADAADKLYGAVAHKRATVLGGGIDQQNLALGAKLGKAVDNSAEEWRASGKIRRLWRKDRSVWTGEDEDKWLGWLDSAGNADIADYEDFARRVKGQSFTDAVVLGMAGHRFIAVTDPGSSLEKAATKQGFARIFHGEPTIGGRYSVLSAFGLVPAAAAGINVGTLIKHTLAMVRSCGADVPPDENPGVRLGLAMGLAGLDGR